VINTLVLIVARMVAIAVSQNVGERSRAAVQFGLYILLQIVLSLLGSLVVNYFSRAREYRADAGGAKLAGKDKMISALRALGSVYGHVDKEHPSLAALKISGRPSSSMAALFATHPSLEDRIRALEVARI
jgi:heat shock protein HtpX